MNFVTTRWELVRGASNESQKALEELLLLYRPAICDYMSRRFLVSRHDAEDLTQGFIVERVLKTRLIKKADPARGRFRNFLLSSVNSYVLDTMRREKAAKRYPEGGLTYMGELAEQQAVLESTEDSERLFDEAVARQLIAEAMRRTAAHCANEGIPEVWSVFNERLLRPLFEGIEPTPFERIADNLGIDSAKNARNKLVTGKRIFRRQLKRCALELDELRESEPENQWILELLGLSQVEARQRETVFT